MPQIIDIDYHNNDRGVLSAEAHPLFGQRKPERASKDPDVAITALLDHLAEELAREYVHLMEKAAGEERVTDQAPR